MELAYPPKIILAWGEAISGNGKIRDWLIKNGYPELGLFVFALHLKQDAREWLMTNGHPALMALVHGAEGNLKALHWLEKNDFIVLHKMALGADNDNKSIEWLIVNGFPDFAVIAQKIRFVKNEIDRDNNDVHKISSE